MPSTMLLIDAGRRIRVEPFLFNGLIAVVRRVLAIHLLRRSAASQPWPACVSRTRA